MNKLLDNRTRARMAILFFVILLIVDFFMFILEYKELNLLALIYEDTWLYAEKTRVSYARLSKMGNIYLLAVIVADIMFLRWFYRAYKNLHIAGVSGLRYSPGWAVGGFFVPIINLVRPYRIIKEIWDGTSQLCKGRAEASHDSGKTRPPIGLWWLLFLVTLFLGNLAAIASIRRGDLNTLLIAYFLISLTEAFVLLTVAVSIIVMKRISDIEYEAYKIQA